MYLEGLKLVLLTLDLIRHPQILHIVSDIRASSQIKSIPSQHNPSVNGLCSHNILTSFEVYQLSNHIIKFISSFQI